MILYTEKGIAFEIEHAIDIKAALETGRYFAEIKKEKKPKETPKPEVKPEDKPMANPYADKEKKIEPKKAGRPKKEEVEIPFPFNKNKNEK